MTIDVGCFHKFDLNALVTFLVVYQEQGVSRAAKVLKVTQPAVSNVLSKLRVRFDDPLFISRGRRLRPTLKAMMIAREIAPAMAVLSVLIASNSAGSTPCPRPFNGSPGDSEDGK